MRQHREVTDRHGTVWYCDLLRLRLIAGADPDVRPRALVLCAGNGESFELELLAADWMHLDDEQLASEIEHAASKRLSPR